LWNCISTTVRSHRGDATSQSSLRFRGPSRFLRRRRRFWSLRGRAVGLRIRSFRIQRRPFRLRRFGVQRRAFGLGCGPIWQWRWWAFR
jgi:hypothetical protein